MMHDSIQWLWVLAARQDMHRVWGRFDHVHTSATDQLLIVLGALALLSIVLFVWRLVARRAVRTFSCDSSWRMFGELCAAHRLNLSSRRLLKRLAATRQLASPTMLFVQPEHFETNTLPDSLQSAAAEIQKLRSVLFD
jgi:hypothetical protein